LKSGPQVFRVRLSDITYISKDGNYLVVHVPERKILIRENMGDVFSIFPNKFFCQIHKSFVVSLRHVTTIDSHQVEVDKTTLPIGATYREELMKRVKERF
jgi:DNA-binding LytR/AlgR family response regulator